MKELNQEDKKGIRSFLDKKSTTGKPVGAIIEKTPRRLRYVLRLEDVVKGTKILSTTKTT